MPGMLWGRSDGSEDSSLGMTVRERRRVHPGGPSGEKIRCMSTHRGTLRSV